RGHGVPPMQYCLPRSSTRTRSGPCTLASFALVDGADRTGFVEVLTGDWSILPAIAATAMKATNSRRILAATGQSPWTQKRNSPPQRPMHRDNVDDSESSMG